MKTVKRFKEGEVIPDGAKHLQTIVVPRSGCFGEAASVFHVYEIETLEKSETEKMSKVINQDMKK